MEEMVSVLIIEDEEHIRDVLEYNLKSDGFEVYLAADGPSGLEIARQKSPQVILLDWMMPDMDGLDVLADLKNDQRTAQIPVFMLTAKGMLSDVETAISMGADDYITKPFDPVRLGGIIKKKLQRFSAAKCR